MHIDLSPSNKVETTPNRFWEVLEADGLVTTKRARVPGGWLVQLFFTAPKDRDHSSLGPMTFVSDPYHEWYLTRKFD